MDGFIAGTGFNLNTIKSMYIALIEILKNAPESGLSNFNGTRRLSV